MRRVALFLALLLVAAGSPADEIERVFHPSKLAEIDATIERAIADRRCPGGVLWIEDDGVAYHRAYGARALEPSREEMTEETIFDAASLTKVMATTPAIALLLERGQIELEAPVARYWPEFGTLGKEAITVRQLLTHTSGLRAGLPPAATGREVALAQACAETPTAPPGTRFRYSDINFIVLGHLVEKISARSLADFCATEIFAPLGMRDTTYCPPAEICARIAPTTRDVARGVVHDPTARRMGGIAGHAGLFTTARDVARFARAFLHDGEHVFQPATVRLLTRVQTPEPVWELRGLGWDIDSPYAGPRGEHLLLGSYGHTGWTGGSLWIDAAGRTFVIFLSNRNHPTEAGSVIALRRTLGTLAAEAIR